jgi:hypothetical protein
VRAAELYRLLDTALAPACTVQGLKRRRASRLQYQRQKNSTYQTVWFQCDTWGWDPYAGSSFFVNFSVTPEPDPESVRQRNERLNFFMTDEELEAARRLRNAIVARIPVPPRSYFERLEQGFRKLTADPEWLAATVRSFFEPERLPYRRNHDLKLRYRQPRDVGEWAEFIRPILPRALEQMDTWMPV